MHRSHHVGLVLPTLACAALLAGCGSSSGSVDAPAQAAAKPAPAGSGTTVRIQDFMYTPAALTVAAGTKVTWTNGDSAPHDARAAGAFDTDTLTKGQSKTVTLAKPGTYHYVCSFHPFMKATITVR